MRIGRVWKAGLLLAVGAAGGGAALAVASVPGSDGMIHACVGVTMTTGGVVVPDQGGAPPDVTVIDPSAGQTCLPPDGTDTVQTELSWNAIGQPGPRGPSGPAGKSATVAAGDTFTISGGTVITVGKLSGTPSPLPIPFPNAKPIGKVTVDLGNSSFSFPLYAWELPGATTKGGGGKGKVQIHDLQIEKVNDSASYRLLQLTNTGYHIPQVTIVLDKKGSGGGGGTKPMPYLTIMLENCVVSSYQTTSGGDRPTESLSLNFTKISYKNQ